MSEQIPEFDFHYCGSEVRLETRDEEGRDDKREVIVGHGAVFYDENDPGTEYRLGRYMRERIDRGAFNGALTRPDDVRALRDHNPELLLGRTASGTLRLSIDQRGLAYEIDPDTTTVGMDTRKMIRRGDMSGSSFGFYVESEEFMDDGEEIIRTIKSVNPLLDVSPVAYPAYQSSESGIGRRKQEFFTHSLEQFILRNRDTNEGSRLEVRARKAFGLKIPAKAKPEVLVPTENLWRRLKLKGG